MGLREHALDLEPVLQSIQQSKMDIDALIRQESKAGMEGTVNSVVRCIQDLQQRLSDITVETERTRTDLSTSMKDLQQRLGDITVESQRTRTDLSTSMKDEVQKLKSNFSVKIDLSPILAAIGEIHDQLALSLKAR